MATPRTVKEVLHKQALDARQQREAIVARRNAAPTGTEVAPTLKAAVATVETKAGAVADQRSPLEKHFDEVSPGMQFAGRRIQFDHQTGEYSTADDGEPIAEGNEYVCLCTEAVGGWIRFNGPGEPPLTVLGLLYDASGYIPPPRNTLSDPEMADADNDPWKRNYMLPLQAVETNDLFTLSFSAQTQNPAIINVLREFERKRKSGDPSMLPVVRLKASSYQSKNYGRQYKPVLVRVGWANRDDAVKPNTSIEADMNDSLDF